jgi:hypothetical protein
MNTKLVLSLLIAASLTGCAPRLASTDPGSAVPGDPATAATVTPIPSVVPEGTDWPLPAQAARRELAESLHLSSDDVRLLSVDAVDWPDASIGCPRLGVLYVPVVTPGYRITLEAGGKNYVYHTDRGDRLVLCPTGDLGPLPTIAVTPGEIDDGQPWMPVN